MPSRRGRIATISAIAVFSVLTLVDAVRVLSGEANFSLSWFLISVVIGAVLVVALYLLVRKPGIRATIEAWGGDFEDRPEGRPVSRREVWKIAAVCLVVATCLGLLAHHRMQQDQKNRGDELKQVRAALAWHAHLASDQGGIADRYPAEPKLAWLLAGLVGQGREEETLRAGRSIALVTGVLLALLVTLAGGYLGGLPGAAVAGCAVLLGPDLLRASSLFTEDTLLALFITACLLAFMAARDRPALWPLAGLLAGLAAATKSSGLLIVAGLVITLLLVKRSRRRWPWIIALAAAASLPLLPHVLYIGFQGAGTKDTELAGLLLLHGPDTLEVWRSKDLPAFPGWLEIAVARFGITTVGDLVVGAARTLALYVLWYVPVLFFSIIGTRDAILRRGGATLAALVLLFLGLVGWKGGDAAHPFFLVGPLCAILLGRVAPALIHRLRKNHMALAVAALLALCAAAGFVLTVAGS